MLAQASSSESVDLLKIRGDSIGTPIDDIQFLHFQSRLRCKVFLLSLLHQFESKDDEKRSIYLA
jgi:hypothetical protein